MNLYIMRHGVTTALERKIVQGRRSFRLSKTGVEEVKKSAKEVKNVNFDYIICSPVYRTRQTARIVNEYHQVKVYYDKRIIEVDQGVFAGRKYNTLNEEELREKVSRNPKYGMETFEEVKERVHEFYKYLLTLDKDLTVLVVTHNLIASYLEDLILNEPLLEFETSSINRFKSAQIKQFNI